MRKRAERARPRQHDAHEVRDSPIKEEKIKEDIKMEMSVVNNLAAYQAQNSLGSSTTNLSNALKQLSTGQRINSAADDPSGLAISERFRTQIRGLARASLNASDGISMFQTAEGALNEVHSALQRMRELAVQSANGVLTSNDRQEVQQEMDQLKEEVNRIANSTEFNTRKLLDGSGAALWSSSSSDISAVITGKVREGNYRLEVSQTAGTNQVLKTDIFKIADGRIGAVDDGTPAYLSLNLHQDAAATMTIVMDGETMSVAFGDATTIGTANSLVNAINNNDLNKGRIEAVLGPNDGDIIIRAKNAGSAGDGYMVTFSGVGAGSITDWAGNDGTAAFTAGLLIGGVLENAALGATASDREMFGGPGNGNSTVLDRVYDPEGLQNGQWDVVTVDNTYNPGIAADTGSIVGAHMNPTGTVSITGVGATVDSNRYVIAEAIQSGGSGAVDLRVSWDQGQNWEYVQDYTSGADITFGGPAGTESFSLSFTGDFASGDKLLLGLQNTVSAANDVLYLQGPASSFTNLSAAAVTMGTDSNHVQTGLWVDTRTDDASLTSGHVLTAAWMDDQGQAHFGSVTVDIAKDFDETSNITHNLSITGSGGPADSNTKLEDVDRFYDVNGNFILGNDGKWIDLYDGAGNKASLFIQGSDTLAVLTDKIAQAISQQETTYGWAGLGLGDVKDGDVSKAATFVQTPSTGDEAVRGTIVIRATQTGIDARLTFNGDESVLNALGLATIREAQNGTMSVDIYDAHTSDLLAQETVGDNVLHNAIAGTDVYLNATSGVTAEWSNSTGKIEFTASNSTQYLHLVDKSMDLQVGANQGQVMSAYVGEMTLKGLGVEGVLAVNQEKAGEAIGSIDTAIQKVSSERARLGAYINRLQYTLNNLAVQEENQTAAESTIRDLNMAKAVSEMTQQQILQQVGTSMLAQANQIPQQIMQLLR